MMHLSLFDKLFLLWYDEFLLCVDRGLQPLLDVFPDVDDGGRDVKVLVLPAHEPLRPVHVQLKVAGGQGDEFPAREERE